MKSLEGKVVLVTGGSRGIGRAISLKCAENGAYVFVNYASNATAANEVVEACQKLGAKAESLGFDVANSEAVTAAIDSIKEKAGKIDILVNNAGISKDGLFIRMKDDDGFKTINTNLSGSFFCARAAAKHMMKERWGRIINMSSIIGESGNAGQVPYAASKAGLLGLTKSLARELASRNITVNAITPGFIDTEMTSALNDQVKAETVKQIPLGRIAQADEVADLVVFLASDKAAYMTGQVVGINGGMRM